MSARHLFPFSSSFDVPEDHRLDTKHEDLHVEHDSTSPTDMPRKRRFVALDLSTGNRDAPNPQATRPVPAQSNSEPSTTPVNPRDEQSLVNQLQDVTIKDPSTDPQQSRSDEGSSDETHNSLLTLSTEQEHSSDPTTDPPGTGVIKHVSFDAIPEPLAKKQNLVAIDLECHCYDKSLQEKLDQDEGRTPFVANPPRRVVDIGLAAVPTTRLPTYGAPSLSAVSSQIGDRYSSLWDPNCKLIEAADIAIREHKHNPRHHRWFCRGTKPEDFIYGRPEYVSKANAAKTVIKRIEQMIDPALPTTFLFFDSNNDLLWLRQLGINLLESFPGSTIVDTQRIPLIRSLGLQLGKTQPAAEDMYEMLGMEIKGGHNGGNDAVHELRAYLAGLVLTYDQHLETAAEFGFLPRLDSHGLPLEDAQKRAEIIEARKVRAQKMAAEKEIKKAEVNKQQLGIGNHESFPALGGGVSSGKQSRGGGDNARGGSQIRGRGRGRGRGHGRGRGRH